MTGLPSNREGNPALKPCPFCGGTKLMLCAPTCNQQTPYDPSHRAHPIVRCMDCFGEICGRDWDAKGDSARAKWNTRASLLPETADRLVLVAEEYRGFIRAAELLAAYGPTIVWELADQHRTELKTLPPSQAAPRCERCDGSGRLTIHDNAGFGQLASPIGDEPCPACAETTELPKPCIHRWTSIFPVGPGDDQACDFCGLSWSKRPRVKANKEA